MRHLDLAAQARWPFLFSPLLDIGDAQALRAIPTQPIEWATKWIGSPGLL